MTQPPFDVARFDVCMFEAVEAAQVGFYFEEGGCWGMAHALFEELRAKGHDARLRYRPSGFVHAWVAIGDLQLDYRGSFNAAPGGLDLVDLDALREAARTEGGTYGESFESDIALARDVVRAALEALEAPEPVTC